MAGFFQTMVIMLLSCSLILFSNSSVAQCPNDNNFVAAGGSPPCGVEQTTTIGAGTFATFNVVSGASYNFNTCGTYLLSGSTFNTQLSGYNGAGPSVFFDNDNNIQGLRSLHVE